MVCGLCEHACASLKNPFVQILGYTDYKKMPFHLCVEPSVPAGEKDGQILAHTQHMRKVCVLYGYFCE